jgi:hypothetical protein
MKTKRYTYLDICEAVENGVRYGVRRAYKHRDDPLPSDEIVEQIAEIAGNEIMNDLCNMIEFEEGL